MPFFGVGPPPSLCSRRPHRTFVPLSPSCRAIIQVETRSLCVHGSRCPSLASDRRRAELSPSRHRARRDRSSRDALVFALMVLDAILWRRAAAVVELSPSTLDVYTALAIVQGDQSVVETRCLRSRGSTPFSRCWQLPPPMCSHRPHRTLIPLSPSCKAIIQVETRSLCAHGSRYPLWRRPPSLSSRRPHRTFIPLSPSCKAIVQVETRSLRSCGARCPSLVSGSRRCRALAVHIGHLYRSRHRARRDRSSRDALVMRSWFSMPFSGVGPRRR